MLWLKIDVWLDMVSTSLEQMLQNLHFVLNIFYILEKQILEENI